MTRPTTTTSMTVRLSAALSDFVPSCVGQHGGYENVSEYLRDVIRRDKERKQQQVFERLKAELSQAYSAAESPPTTRFRAQSRPSWASRLSFATSDTSFTGADSRTAPSVS